MWLVGATNPYAAFSLQLAWAKWHFWIFTSFLFACFFSLQEMFYICGIIQGYPPLSPPIEFAPTLYRVHVWCHFDGWVQNLKISTTSMLAFYLLLTTEVKCLRICKRGTMNELPVIGSLRLRTDFWDRHVADIVTRYKGTHGERFVWTSKKCDFGKRLWLFRSSFIIHGER